ILRQERDLEHRAARVYAEVLAHPRRHRVHGQHGAHMNDGGWYGKYRGTVTNNVDDQHLGRVQVSCPTALQGGKLSWAMPCAPYAGAGVGLFMVPPVGANVWVEFENGDLDYPIWAGCFWGENEVPAAPATAD